MTYIDGDTVYGPGSLEAALRAAGGACAAVDAVMEGWAKAAFVATRPPGHHAESDRAMGFCLFNNVAVAALSCAGALGVAAGRGGGFRRASRQWHAGYFRERSGVVLCLHASVSLLSGHGPGDERGVAGNVVNVPLPPGSGSDDFRAAWERDHAGAGGFSPELLIISAGFDAHAADPLAQLRLREADFTWVTEALLAVADAHCPGRVVSLLEGGYDLEPRRLRGRACPRADAVVNFRARL